MSQSPDWNMGIRDNLILMLQNTEDKVKNEERERKIADPAYV